MAFFGFGGGGEDVSITINGNSDNLQGAVRGAESALRSLSSAADSGNQSFTGYRFTMQSLGNDLLDNLGTFGASVITLNSLLGIFGMLGGAVTNVVGSVGQFVENLAQVAASDAWQALSYGADQAERLGQAMFDLNNQTERNVFNWTYLYGGPNNGGTQTAAQLAAWTQQFSMQIPYTRQDLMSAVTTLSAEPGATPSAIEQQMQLLSDVAATQGRPGLTLSWAAQAALRASQAGKGSGGSLRMLMMDLNLNKGELAPFGYNENDPSTFWTALEGYEKSKGSYGASKAISTQTFWGASSSFEDRIQNFLLAAGGTDITGQVQKGSFFGNLKQDLVDVSQWMDSHQKELSQLANIISQLYGGAVETGTNGLTAFLQALHSTGIDTTVERDLADFAQWLAEPDTQAGIREFGGLLGQLVGTAGLDLRNIFGSLWQGLTSSGIGQTLLDDVRGTIQWLSDPQNQHMLEQLGFILGQGIGQSAQLVSNKLGDIVSQATDMMRHLRPDDLALIAGAFSEMALGISATADSVMFLTRETFDLIHLMEDYANGNYPAMVLDAMQANNDAYNYVNSIGGDIKNAANMSGQMQAAMMQWQQQNQVANPVTPATGSEQHVTHASLVNAITSTRVQHETGVGSGRAASLMGMTLTEGLSSGIIGDLSHLTSTGRVVMGEFTNSLIAASTSSMDGLGKHIASTIADAVREHVSAEFRIQNSSSLTARMQPGGGRSSLLGGSYPRM